MRFPGVVGAAVLTVACGGGSSSKPGTSASGPAPTCVAVGDHVKKLKRKSDETVDRLREVFVERCERDGWSPEFRSCVLTTETLEKPKRCKDLLGGLQREALDRGVQEAEYGSAQTACHRYVRIVKRLSTCSTYTKDMVESYVSMAENYLSEMERAEDNEQREYLIQSCESMVQDMESRLASCNP